MTPALRSETERSVCRTGAPPMSMGRMVKRAGLVSATISSLS
jgi:hypothetical protein